MRDESLDRIHRHSQLLGDHLSHLGVHPLTHLDPAVGDGHTAVIVVDGNVDCVPDAGESISINIWRRHSPGAELIMRILERYKSNPAFPPKVPLVEILHMPLPQLELGGVFQPRENLLQGRVVHLGRMQYDKTISLL